MSELRFFDELETELERATLRHHPARTARVYRWARRKLVIGGFGVTPAVLVAVVATAAAATGGAVLVSHSHAHHATKPTARRAVKRALKPVTLFRKDPGSPFAAMKHIPKDISFRKETVIPASARVRVSTIVPHYGRVQFWAATTRQGGFCFAIRLPDGAWAGYPLRDHFTDGFDGGTMPGCIDTEQQRSMGVPSVEAPTIYEGFQDYVKSHTGKEWELFFGYVTTQGRAATVKDPWMGDSARVTHSGYFLLMEPPSQAPGNDMLNVFDAAGHELQPDYTRTSLLPGYKMGPTLGPRR